MLGSKVLLDFLMGINLVKCCTLSRWWSIWSRPGGVGRDVSMGSALSEVDMWKEFL